MHEDAGSVEVCVALTTETAKDVVVRIVGSKNNISELVFEGREGENDSSTFSHIHVHTTCSVPLLDAFKPLIRTHI